MTQPDDHLIIARARIAEEAEQRTGALDLRNLGLPTLPEELFTLRHLRRLDLGTSEHWEYDGEPNRIDARRERLGTLTRLEVLSVAASDLGSLDPLRTLTALQKLDCSDTRVIDLAPLAGLTALQRLDCSWTRVTDLAPLAGLTALQKLNCNYTHVTDLTPLAGLTALQNLDCSGSQVTDLAPLAGLTALQELYCDRCRLQTLPRFLWDDRSLIHLNLYDARVPGLPREVLSPYYNQNCLPAVRAHYADLEAEAAEITEVRVLLLGNGGVGKTQIARWLSDAGFEAHWDSTHGIRITDQPPADSVAARLHLHLWDFGGQDIYHGTHALFLRHPAVLVLVWSKDRENRESYQQDGLSFRNHPLAYWVDVVRHLGSPDSPVLIVQTKCDGKDQDARRFPVPEAALEALPSPPSELRVSPKTGRGRAALEDALQDAIAWLHAPNRLGRLKIGAGRLRVQRRLEALRDADRTRPRDQRRHRLLERQTFEALCAEAGGVSSPEQLLAYLDANGTVLHRPGLFHDRIVLDQGWALDAIYAVFERKSVYQMLRSYHGRFSRALLNSLVWQEHSASEQRLLLSLMLSCGICFRHHHSGAWDDDHAQYIAPDLLPERAAIADTLPVYWADDRPAESARFHYPFLHGGLIRAIMAGIGDVAGLNGLYWRGGLCAYEATTRSRVLIEEEMTGLSSGTLQVRTQDGQAAALLQRIIASVEEVQQRLGLRSTVEQAAPPVARRDEKTPLQYGPEPPQQPQWYVSYAWGDDRTPDGQKRNAVVDKLCADAKARGHEILRDCEVLRLGERLSAFMKQLGAGDRIFVILSDNYLRSYYCMFELSEIWRTSKQEDKAFLDRVRLYALPGTKVEKPGDWVDWAIHWKHEHDDLDQRARDHGAAILGTHAHHRLMQMQRFYTQVADILGTLADRVQPRSLGELERDGFEP